MGQETHKSDDMVPISDALRVVHERLDGLRQNPEPEMPLLPEETPIPPDQLSGPTITEELADIEAQWKEMSKDPNHDEGKYLELRERYDALMRARAEKL